MNFGTPLRTPNAASKLRFAVAGTHMRHLAAKSPYFSMIPWTNLGTYMDSERTIIRSIGTYMRYPTVGRDVLT